MDEDLICHQCLNEAYLIGLIRRTGVTAECSFCLKRRNAIPLEVLVNMVDDVLQKYCHPGAIYDQYDDNGKRSETEQTGDPLVFHVAELLGLNEDDPVVERVLCDLNEGSHYDIMQGGEARYSDDENYEWGVIRPRDAEARWLNFQNEMKHGNRFFSQHAKGFWTGCFKYFHPSKALMARCPLSESLSMTRSFVLGAVIPLQSTTRSLISVPQHSALHPRRPQVLAE